MPTVKTVEPPDLYYENFTEGREFPTVTKGPLTSNRNRDNINAAGTLAATLSGII
jgi:hypothetical protein